MSKCVFGCGRELKPNSKLVTCSVCRAGMRRRDKMSLAENIEYRKQLSIRESRLEQILPFESIPVTKRIEPQRLIPLSKLFGKPIQSRRDPARRLKSV